MKYIIFFTLLAVATCAEVIVNPVAADFSLSGVIIEAIESIRDQMPCGFPEQGIPVLAPYSIDKKEVNIDEDFLRMNGIIEDFTLNGLNDFDIIEMQIKPITSSINFYIVFNNVNIDTTYDTKLFLKQFGFSIDLIGSGSAKFAVKDVHIRGHIKYRFNVISRKLKLKTLDLRTQIGDVSSDIEGIFGEGKMNRRFNIGLQTILKTAINESEDKIAAAIEKVFLPVANNILDKKSLIDLTKAINDGSANTCNSQLIL